MDLTNTFLIQNKSLIISNTVLLSNKDVVKVPFPSSSSLRLNNGEQSIKVTIDVNNKREIPASINAFKFVYVSTLLSDTNSNSKRLITTAYYSDMFEHPIAGRKLVPSLVATPWRQQGTGGPSAITVPGAKERNRSRKNRRYLEDPEYDSDEFRTSDEEEEVVDDRFRGHKINYWDPLVDWLQVEFFESFGGRGRVPVEGELEAIWQRVRGELHLLRTRGDN